jgi:hypothetical protein
MLGSSPVRHLTSSGEIVEELDIGMLQEKLGQDKE